MKSTNETVKAINSAARKNGWDIVAASVSMGDSFTCSRCVVLVKRDRATFDGREYSTHEFGNGGFFWGHYDLTADEARADYVKRSGHQLNQGLLC
jgi:hypothetical protein